MALNELQKKERSEYLEKNLNITECSQGQPYAFISYASDNWEKVFKDAVVPLQQTYGLCVYADKAFDKVNDRWIVPMLRNIRGADVVLVFVSQQYIESYACFLELLTAVNSKKSIVFVSLEEELRLGNTTDQFDLERGVKNEMLNQGANISINTNNTSNDLMRAMKSAYTSISTLLEQDALSKYDISDAFINFFRDASVNRKTIHDLKAIKRTISSINKEVFDKTRTDKLEQLAVSVNEVQDPTLLEGAQSEVQTPMPQENAATSEGRRDDDKPVVRSAEKVFRFDEPKKGGSVNKRPLIIIAAAAAVLMIGVLLYMVFGGYDRIKASGLCSQGNRCLSELDYQQAIAFYQSAIGTYPKAEDAYIGLADAYVGLGDYESAVAALETGVQETKSEQLKEYLADRYYEVGCVFLFGQEINLAEAHVCFEKALENGKTEANFYLGELCDRYNYPERDYEKAREYYEADSDDPYSQIALGILYYNGRGVEKDTVKAQDIFDAVIEAGCVEGYWGSGVIAFDNEDYDTALECWNKVLEGDESLYNADAMRNIGNLYYFGQGVKQDYAQAKEWWEKAAELGDAAAMSNIGVLYEFGEGIEYDYTQAVEWYEKGAELGNDTAMRNIGLMYATGRGIKQDYARAIEWWEEAAALGNIDAMRDMGLLYENGQGVEQDYAQAAEWYERAAVLGNVDAMNNIGNLYYYGQGVEQDYDQAKEWYEKAAELGNVGAMRNFGMLYENGEGVAQDYAQAAEWYEGAAELGDVTAMYRIGLLYENGQGVAQDYAQAMEWYEEAAGLGNANAMRRIGNFYYRGEGVAQDYTQAAEWYWRAAELGDVAAMNNMGVLYDLGQGVEQDYGLAMEWFEKAAALGNADAMNNIGVLYENGEGVEQDAALAAEWYEKADQAKQQGY
ncbi:MAG: TIR domain-containing protein [Lachnospiraceae bacterium]|nr:TIR domain-containing protein [Lachnospiraceae bacterium]